MFLKYKKPLGWSSVSGSRRYKKKKKRGEALTAGLSHASSLWRIITHNQRSISSTYMNGCERNRCPLSPSGAACSSTQPPAKSYPGAKSSLLRLIDGFIFISALMIYSAGRLLLVSFRNGCSVKNTSLDWCGHVSPLSCSVLPEKTWTRRAQWHEHARAAHSPILLLVVQKWLTVFRLERQFWFLLTFCFLPLTFSKNK